MFQSRTSPPANYNFGHFAGYMPQSTQYNPTAVSGQTHGDYNQFQMDPTAFQQAQCYMAYGSRPVEEWVNNYSMGPSQAGTVSPHNYNYRHPHHMNMEYPQGQISHAPVGQTLTMMGSSPQPVCSPTASTSSSNGSPGSPSNKQLRPPFDWMKKTSYAPSGPAPGKTRTKDKYRVVYSDHQRLELEKEFHYSRYITIRRKAELAQALALSERQVKIWFQNRRAKERKQNKKRDEAITGSGITGSSDIQIHETGSHVQGLGMNVHGSQVQPSIKQDIDDYCPLSSPVNSPQEHSDQNVQGCVSPEISVPTSLPVSTSVNLQMQPAVPVSVIKMDPHDLTQS
ncbi:hypothetical protein FSP39_006469 [Pinctada imbricata]|uniref:Homeobox domain-containing protein n=1 Tax=Pinctada imbricata TaxID=66713 RepID=A0AA88Y6W4_PINIB|nr:hypothetical protein FSP39_006469 [Pinctada imbricata]